MKYIMRNLFYSASDTGGSGSETNIQTASEEATDNQKNEATLLPTTDDELQSYVAKQIEEKQLAWQQEYEQKLEQAKKDTERLAQLSAAEREKEILKQKSDEISKKEAEFRQKEIIFEATKILAAKNISPEFASIIADSDLEKTKANISLLEKHISKEVEKGIMEKLKSKSPVPSQLPDTGNVSSFMQTIANNRLR